MPPIPKVGNEPRLRPPGDPMSVAGERRADASEQGSPSPAGELEGLGALGRPPTQPDNDKIGRFTRLGRVSSDTLSQLVKLPEADSNKTCAAMARMENRMSNPDDPACQKLFDYYAKDESAARINSALRSGDAAQIEPIAAEVESMMPMLTSLPPGMKFNRVLLSSGGWGQKPLEEAAFSEMERQLRAAAPGTVIREEGLMSTATDHEVHGEWEGQRGVHLRLTTGEKGVRTMAISDDPQMFTDCVFPPGQRMVITGTEQATLQHNHTDQAGATSAFSADMLVVHAALLKSEAYGGYELQDPSDSEPEPSLHEDSNPGSATSPPRAAAQAVASPPADPATFEEFLRIMAAD